MKRPHALGLLAAALLAGAAASAAPPARSDLIGTAGEHVLVDGETLLDVARRHDVGYVELLLANPGADPWLPAPDLRVQLPTQHLLPDAPRRGIVINLPELRLYFFPPGGGAPLSFPIGIGDEGKDTPTGRTTVARKQAQPTWRPTPSERIEDPALPEAVPPGPDNPMGERAIYLGWRGYAIHGTNKPLSIGRRDSHGCIRLYPEDAETLFRAVRPGTPVLVVDQPVKLGRHEGELYLEVHPAVAEANRVEAGGRPELPPDSTVNDILVRRAGPDAVRLDWETILAAEIARSGVPVRITKPAPLAE